MDNRTDELLVVACRGGDSDAYATLIRRHVGRIYAVCLGMLGNVSDSEDLAQEALVKGLKNIHTLQDGNHFAGWIAQIARNLCRDFIRTQKRRRDLLAENAEGNEKRAGEFSDLKGALAELPEKYRLPLLLYYFDGHSSKSVAKVLNISQAGACTRLSRARKELRKLLDREAESS